MKDYILKIPSSQDAKDWFNFINESLKHTENVSQLIVDFNDVSFMDTDEFVVLACLIESFYINGCSVIFTGGVQKFNNHLSNIKFKEYWTKGFDRSKYTSPYNRTTLCLWKISEDMIYPYSIYARKYFERFAKDKDLLPLTSNMYEVFNNIFDHSKSPVTGYIITQYYPANKKLSFSVCDFGIGIPTSIKEANIEQEPDFEDWEAILRSLDEGFSINSTPRNRGFGLNSLLEFTESSRGRLLIISNDGILEKKAGEEYRKGSHNPSFSGTLIKVEVDLDTFEEKDDSDQIYDF